MLSRSINSCTQPFLGCLSEQTELLSPAHHVLLFVTLGLCYFPSTRLALHNVSLIKHSKAALTYLRHVLHACSWGRREEEHSPIHSYGGHMVLKTLA